MQQQNQIANNQQVQFLEKKLTLAEEKNEAMKNLIQSKDEEIENSLTQKNALTNLFENDLMQITEKLIGHMRNVKSQDDLMQTQNEVINLQKLIALCFQAIKGSSGAINDMSSNSMSNGKGAGISKMQLSQRKQGTEKENNDLPYQMYPGTGVNGNGQNPNKLDYARNLIMDHQEKRVGNGFNNGIGSIGLNPQGNDAQNQPNKIPQVIYQMLNQRQKGGQMEGRYQ